MSLSYAIEYLLSLERPGGGRLIHHGAAQIFIPIFPANTSLVLNISPAGGVYAHLNYVAGFSSSMVPDAFHVSLSIWGTKPINAILSADWLTREHVDGYMIETLAHPSYLLFSNRSPLDQCFEMTIALLIIENQTDYSECMDALRRMGTSAKLESLALECKQLLTIMAQGRIPAPMPAGG